MKPSDPEVSLFIIDAFLEIGRTAKIREIVDRDSWKFEKSLARASVQGDMRKTAGDGEFERVHGTGSCINLEDPTTARCVATGDKRFNPVEVANALKAPRAERVKILA
ncbi:hypothetical protein [Rhizobium sp. 007]|uniref:hypothetical protein n=1 Tax=Rhizobium sp. 007 TaxID=2785056 RepID=UPI001890A3DE|nr:hypothetical protein [Rhizobium sp. 007]QPB20918.1 hypothetical protein ISN39_05330 [Rhizobium sp. 007]